MNNYKGPWFSGLRVKCSSYTERLDNKTKLIFFQFVSLLRMQDICLGEFRLQAERETLF